MPRQQRSDDDDYYSPGEIIAGIKALSDSDKAKIAKASKFYSNRCDVPARDLRQQAFLFAMDGTRRCRKCFTIRAFIIGIIKSLASNAEKLEFIDSAALERHTAVLWAEETLSPEDEALSRLYNERILARIFLVIKDDPLLTKLVDGRCQGLRGDRLREYLDLSPDEFAAVKKKLRRRLLRLLDTIK